MQIDFDFSTMVHTKENNSHSEKILDSQYERLSNNCKTLYNAFERGESLSGSDIVRSYKMMEYRRRIKDLKDAGYPIGETILKNGSKIWFKKV